MATLDVESPYAVATFADDAVAAEFASHVLLCRRVGRLWGVGATLEEAVASFAIVLEASEAAGAADAGRTWSMEVSGYGSTIPSEAKDAARAAVAEAVGPFAGRVRIRGASLPLVIAEERRHVGGDDGGAWEPLRWWVYRHVAAGLRDRATQYALSKRRFLGPTSMDTDLAFIMCRLGGVRRGSTMLDPFAGTGSILVPAAVLGAACTASEIDWRILFGKKRCLLDNFDQYGLPRCEVAMCDLSRMPVTPSAVFDAIVCDPPYGLRAGARRSGAADPSRVVEGVSKVYENHTPMSQAYPAEAIYADLMTFATRHLPVGGRLVFWVAALNDHTEDDLPAHPCLRRVAFCAQGLNGVICRVLVVLEKTRDFASADEAAATREATATRFGDCLKNIRARVFRQHEAKRAAAAGRAAERDGAGAGAGSDAAAAREEVPLNKRGRRKPRNPRPEGPWESPQKEGNGFGPPKRWRYDEWVGGRMLGGVRGDSGARPVGTPPREPRMIGVDGTLPTLPETHVPWRPAV